jgi:peptide/nickel transport system ATP-binding protein
VHLDRRPPGPLLQLRDWTVTLPGKAGQLLRGVDLSIERGTVAALIGESGSGKTLLARSIVDLLPGGTLVTASSALFDGDDFLLSQDRRVSLRGGEIGFVFQEPLSSLNPTVRVGVQLCEGLAIKTGRTLADCRDAAIEMLDRVRIRNAASCLSLYPHELSGGMRQRVMIAAALLPRPRLVIADEPTTALDPVIRAEILRIIRSCCDELGTSFLLITHDLASAATVSDHMTVLYRGSVVESAPTADLFAKPQQGYTQSLLDAARLPPREAARARPRATPPLLELRDVTVAIPTPILDRVSLELEAGETLAVIGESGSGKTTLSRVVAGLRTTSAGEVRFGGTSRNGAGRLDGDVQLVFQDSFAALDPRRTVSQSVGEGLRRRGLPAGIRNERIRCALADVGLDASFLDRLPHQLSGGQRQRVGIARAIIVEPRLIVADEPVAALDPTVQKQVLELFLRLQQERGFACLFVSHDLPVVEHVADRVCVLRHGRIVEMGSRDAIFDRPQHPYTRELMVAARGHHPASEPETAG